MTILVCAATGKELAALAPGRFPDPEAIGEMRPIMAELKRDRAIFLVTGPGPVNAAMALGYVFGLTRETDGAGIDAVLCAGLAGAFDLASTPLKSLWRVDREIWPEYGLNDGATVTARAFSFPLWKRPEGDIYDSVELSSVSAITPEEDFKGKPWPGCASLTVAGVSASFARRERLWDAYHAPLENMEGFAVAYAAARAETPCVEIRAVSNKVGPRSRNEKDFDGALEALGKVLPSLNLI